MAKCFYCNMPCEELLYTISNGEESISVCPNCSIINLKNIEFKPATTLKCELCGAEGYSFDGVDIHSTLCENHIHKLLYLSLDSAEFKKLYENNPNEYFLHDDFYCPDTGIALQPNENV